jgi:hypothetical protein
MALMAGAANFEDYGRALADAIEAALPEWVVRCVDGRVRDYTGADPTADVLRAAHEAGNRAREEVGSAVRALLAQDVDDQRTNPLALVRRAVSYPTEVLRAAGVLPVVRDEFEERAFPDDIYALSPASFADVDPSLHEPGLLWGAAKAHAHLSRRQTRGNRGR